MENSQVAKAFEDIADLIELEGGNAFRIRSYRNAARTVKDLSERVDEKVKRDDDLSKLPNIGKSTADKIKEIAETGTCKRLEDLKKQMPEELIELMHVPELGPKKVKAIYDALGVQTLEDLKEACEKHKVRDLEGMGAKTEENILKGIKTLQTATGRFLRKEARDQVRTLEAILQDCKEVNQFQVAGSYRRCKETVGDLDFLVEAADRPATTEKILDDASVEDVIGKGREKLSVRLASGMQVDFRYFDQQAFGAALIYFTGSKAHNIAIRKIAVDKDWKLNEYGLFENDKLLAGKTEKEVYKKLGLDWIPPELREDNGEVEAARNSQLPKLVELKQIRGDLHCHTKATDGKNTINEMAEAARAFGYDYLGICDHSQAVRVAGGLNEDELQKHAEEIRKVDAEYDDFWLLAGVEVDIMKDGTLDIDEKILKELDWVTASIHYNFNLSPDAMTKRLLAAIESGVVNSIGHPFGRQFGRRDPLQFDVDKVFNACRENHVCLEINAQPERLDLLDVYCGKARDAGAKIVINTDSHTTDDLDFMEFGIGIARRGWLEKNEILNTKTLKQLKNYLKK